MHTTLHLHLLLELREWREWLAGIFRMLQTQWTADHPEYALRSRHGDIAAATIGHEA